MSIRIYTGEGCENCERTMGVLTRKGIAFEAVDVDTLSEAETDELRARGFRSLPVVITDDDAWCGLRVDKLVALTAAAVAR